MDIGEWNECLFDALVRDVGAPGDPLYLYVDDEVLASASGARSPEEALDDFKQAFRATEFRVASGEANEWMRRGFEGLPPHIAALAMTVLGVTLAPLGRAEHNVYSRQRELLGLEDLDGGVPPQYRDFVPGLWKIWNEWLTGPGAIYGLPTARSHEHFTLQGWARSQSFIRARDKQDLYAFFTAKADALLSLGTQELVPNLGRWLREQGSSSRLLRAAEEPDVADELAQCVAAALSYWQGTIQPRALPARLKAVPQWSVETGTLSLIVIVADQRGATGVEIVDLALERWVVGSHDRYMFLTPEGMSAAEWAETPIRSWRFGKTWTVDWEPPRSRVWFFEEYMRGVWILSERVRPDGLYRALLVDGSVPLPAALEVAGGPEEFGAWINYQGSPAIDGRVLVDLLDLEERDAPRLSLRLRGGLKVDSTATYLVGGEPDIEICGVIGDGNARVEFDGEPVSPEIVILNTGPRIRTRSLYAAPGHHKLVLLSDGQSSSVRFATRDPHMQFGTADQARPVVSKLSAPIVPWHEGSTTILLLSESGLAWTAVPDGSISAWLAEVVSGAGFALEHSIDLNNLERPGGARTLVAARRAKRGAWRVGVVEGDLSEVARAGGLAIEKVELQSPVLVQFLFSSSEFIYVSAEAKTALADFRAAVSANFRGKSERAVLDDVQSARVAADSSLEGRTDIRPGPTPDNPLDDFIYWLSEIDQGVSTHLASETLGWLFDCYGTPNPLDLREIVGNLRTLGYLDESATRGRLKCAPTAAALLPSAEGLSLLTGARGEYLMSEMRSPSDHHPAHRSTALQDLIVYESVQLRNNAPLAPTTTYVRFGSDDPSAQASALGIGFSAHSASELLAAIAPIRDRLTTAGHISDTLGPSRLDEFVPSDMAPGGRWRTIGGLPTKDAFIRARTQSGDRYLWWQHATGSLVECGWIAGLWAFHSRFTKSLLVDRVPSRNQLLVSEWTPLPSDLERAMIARSGLLPRAGLVSASNTRWWVYENVPGRVVVQIRELLGQDTEMQRPTAVEFL